MNNLKNLPYPIQIFVFGGDTKLGEEIVSLFEIESPAKYTIKYFKDGERIPHQTETVRDRDVFIIFTSLIGEDMDKWAIDYLRFVWSVKNGQPHKITVVIPKLPHQRQDEENRGLREPKMSNFFPELFKAVGMDRMVVCKLHNPASCTTNPPMENLHTTQMLIKKIEANFDVSKIVMASADMGGSKNTRIFAGKLSAQISTQIPIIIVDKDRNKETGKTGVMNVYTESEISTEIDTVIFVDDIISTFESLSNAAVAIRDRYEQITKFYAIVTHADFSEVTVKNITNSIFTKIIVTNTVPIPENFKSKIEASGKILTIISLATLIAQTIDNLHNGDSVSAIWR